MSVTRKQEQDQTAQLAEQFNQFYSELQAPHVTQVGNYSIIKEIGEGAFGKVYLAQHLLLDVQVVLKCGRLEDPTIVREIYYHRQLRHKNVVRLYEVIRTETHLWMALEYCEGNELYHYIYEQRRLDIEVCRHLFFQLADAIRYVHLLNLSHRDLKLENILLADKSRTVVKLTDFGFVREFSPYKRLLLSTVCGTTAYMPPEVLQRQKYSGFASDIWSMGVILYAMVYGQLPFDADDEMRTKLLIVHQEPELRDLAPPEVVLLLRKMLSKDPQARPLLTDILNSPFLIDLTTLRTVVNRSLAFNDSGSIMLINQHYKINAMPFQLKIERHLLKKMEKLNFNVDQVQAAVFAGQANSLLAFYELALALEYKKKRARHLKKKRYYEAKRQLKKSRKRVRSALSLLEQAPPLEKIILSLSLSLRQDGAPRTRRTLQSAHLSGLHLSASAAPSPSAPSPGAHYSSAPSPGAHYSSAPSPGAHPSAPSPGARPVLLTQQAPLALATELPPQDPFPQETIIPQTPPAATITTTATPLERQVSFYPADDRSAFSVESPKRGKRILGRLQFWRRHKEPEEDTALRVSAPSSALELVAPAAEQAQRPPEFHHSYRTRPDSVVSQMSQYSQLSHMYALSESEVDLLPSDDEYFDDLYELSINTLQQDLPRPLPMQLLSSRKLKRPQSARMPSDTLILSGTRMKKSLISQVSSNSSDDGRVFDRSLDGVRTDALEAPRPPLPQGLRPMLRLRPGVSPKPSFRKMHTPAPLPAGGLGRPLSPVGALPKAADAAHNNAFKWPGSYDALQVDTRRDADKFEHKFIKIEEEEEEEDDRLLEL